MCVGFNAIYTPEFLEYYLSGPLGRWNRALLIMYFTRIRLCRVVLHPDEHELADSRVDVCDCRLLARQCSTRLDLCFKVGEQEDGQGPRTELIERSRQAAQRGLVRMRVQTARTKTEYCHCCSCCCQVLVVVRRLGRELVSASGMVPGTNATCTGCGQCAAACPVGTRRPGSQDDSVCIGCGVCAVSCPHGAVTMQPAEPVRQPTRKRRPFSPLVARAVALAMMLYVMALYRRYSRSLGHDHGRTGEMPELPAGEPEQPRQ